MAKEDTELAQHLAENKKSIKVFRRKVRKEIMTL